MRDILLINGPNLGRLGLRQPEIYGTVSLAEIEERVRTSALASNLVLKCFQSDVEGEIIRFINAHRNAPGMMINPGALMMNGWCLRDCLEDFEGFKVELHISNIFSREEFRTRSVLAGVMNGMIAGFGAMSYLMALSAIETTLSNREGDV